EKTQPNESLLVFGHSWSSSMAYYSERKTLTLPNIAPPELVKKILDDPQAYLGDAPLGGIVLCPLSPIETIDTALSPYGPRRPAIDAFIAGHPVIAEMGGCQLLSPTRSPPSSG